MKTVPESGASGVDPALTELRVTFSKEMEDGSWSWVKLGDGSFPETTDQPRYLDDKRTCVLPVRLEPGKAYAMWINVDSFANSAKRFNQIAIGRTVNFISIRFDASLNGPEYSGEIETKNSRKRAPSAA